MSRTPQTDAGKEAMTFLASEEWAIAIRTVELEASALTLDAAREHMACACDGIEGHLAVRGLLPESLS